MLVVGGVRDPNLTCLVAALRREAIPCIALLAGANEAPAITWDLGSEELWIDGQNVAPQGIFLRHDVFGPLAEKTAAAHHRALAWYSALVGYALATPAVRFPNRRAAGAVTNKLDALRRAAALGLAIPATRVTNLPNEARSFLDERGKIAKPVAGGGLCFDLEEALGKSKEMQGHFPSPALVQEALLPPELRIYRVGEELFGFHVRSSVLDYRGGTDTRVERADVPSELGARFLTLCEQMGLDFAAGDFKTRHATGELVFLEVNTGPMFAAFDAASEGALTNALATWLRG